MKNVVKFNLCQKGCCPTVEFDQESIMIRDDEGGKVTLTPEQFGFLIEKSALLKGDDK